MLGTISQEVRWQDAVDILVLTVVVFRLYTWLRGTVALRIGLGMLVLVGTAFAADELGLLLTTYVLQALGAVATLVVVVVFRDEIRRGLARANPLRWWRERRVTSTDRSAYATLARAVFTLAQHRIGAILVLPREDRIDGHLTGGTVLDAVPSPALLEAVFQPASPIHDGAAVIHRGRVRMAGAFLPVSTATDVPDEMGSRHRAALGLSEHCDAVVLAVSEERGRVSVAVNGRFAPPVADVGALTDTLERLLGDSALEQAEAPRPRWRSGVAFLGSLALVIVAWYVVVAGPSTLVSRSVPVELHGLPDGIEPELLRPQQVTVQVHGPRSLVGELDAGDVTAWIEVGDGKRGKRTLPVQARVPSGFRVIRIAPDRVEVRLRAE